MWSVLSLNYTSYIEKKKWMKTHKIPSIYENFKIARTFYHSEYTFWGNSMLLQSEKNIFLKLKITVLGMFWKSGIVHHIKFQSSGNSNKCLISEWIKQFSIPWRTSVWHWTFHWPWDFRGGLPNAHARLCNSAHLNIAEACPPLFHVLGLDILALSTKREAHT